MSLDKFEGARQVRHGSSLLQCVAMWCSVLQYGAVCCSVCCSVLQCVAVCCNIFDKSESARQVRHGSWLWCSVVQCVLQCVLPCVAVCCSVLQRVATYLTNLQVPGRCDTVHDCVAVWCRVLPCVAVCCCVLWCVALVFQHICQIWERPAGATCRTRWYAFTCATWIMYARVSWLLGTLGATHYRMAKMHRMH